MLEADLLERDGWTRDDLLAYQKERVRALITHAASRSAYYRDVLGPDAAERPLAELPTLSKATLMTEFDRVVTDPQLRLSDLRAHLAGPDPSQSFLGMYRVATTTGTTGRRSIIAFTNDEAAAWRAASARPIMRHRDRIRTTLRGARQSQPSARDQAGAGSAWRSGASDFGSDTDLGAGCRSQRPATRGTRRSRGHLEGTRRGADRRSPADRSTRGLLQQ